MATISISMNDDTDADAISLLQLDGWGGTVALPERLAPAAVGATVRGLVAAGHRVVATKPNRRRLEAAGADLAEVEAAS